MKMSIKIEQVAEKKVNMDSEKLELKLKHAQSAVQQPLEISSNSPN